LDLAMTILIASCHSDNQLQRSKLIVRQAELSALLCDRLSSLHRVPRIAINGRAPKFQIRLHQRLEYYARWMY
jgi:hypothetical protein